MTTPCTGTVIFWDKSPLATALHTRATSETLALSSLSSSTALMPLSNAAVARGPGGTTRGDPEGDPLKLLLMRLMVKVSVIAFPHVGQPMCSRCEVEGAEAVPL